MTNARWTTGWSMGWMTGRAARMKLLAGAALGLALVATLAGCDAGNTSATGTTATKLSQLQWCDKPLISFQDNGSTSQSVITSWSAVKDQLGFTYYLPPTMPKGTCLVLAGGVIHDPIFGSHISITYNQPGDQPISFSEAPKRPNLDNTLQCRQDSTGATPAATATTAPKTATPAPATTVCLGVIGNTSVAIAARQSTAELQTLFKSLQSNVAWVPSDMETATATATKTK